jgi:hypothetical protein
LLPPLDDCCDVVATAVIVAIAATAARAVTITAISVAIAATAAAAVGIATIPVAITATAAVAVTIAVTVAAINIVNHPAIQSGCLPVSQVANLPGY